MDGLAIAAALREVRSAVEGGFVRSVYQPAKSTLVLHVYAGGNRRILLSPRNATIHLTKLSLPNPAKPSPFVMLLRRHLRGGRIVSARQRGWDRVVTLDVERKDGRTTKTNRLVAELTGVRGNLHLLEDGTVLGSAHLDRRNRPGEAYAALRPQDKVDPSKVSAEELAEILAGENPLHGLIRAVDGIGRATAEDLLRGLDERADAHQRASVVQAALREIVSCIETPSPRVVAEQERATFYPLPPPAEPARTFGEALDAVSETSAEGAEAEASALGSELRRAMVRRARTLEKLRDWLDDADEADRFQRLGDLLMIHHGEIEPKAEGAVLIDPETENEVTIRLAPWLTAIENAQRLYERAKRLRRGRPHVTSRIERLRGEIELLEAATEAHRNGRAVGEEALALLPKAAARPVAPKREGREIRVDGFTILIGRSAAENDRLLRDAAADDLWLHAKGFAGSHVVVRRGGRREIPEAVVERAAKLAAAHSKARGERRVQVVVAEAKHVRKPPGAAPGVVNVSEGDTLTVEP